MRQQNRIRTHRNTVFFDTTNGEETVIFKQVISFLRRRGFKVGVNPTIKEMYSSISKNHKIGYKKDIACLIEIYSDCVKIEFGHVKNLWKDLLQSFWSSKTDDRYTHLSYLEELAVKLEIKKTVYYAFKKGFVIEKNDSQKSPEEFIVDKLKINKHIHGNVTCLEDIKKDMTIDSYNYKNNSNDANGKKIICGEKKYYYDYRTKRIMYGYAWHNINNMWWVILGNKFKNIASFELFDYSPDMPRRKQLGYKELLTKVQNVLKSTAEKRYFERCVKINNFLKKLEHQKHYGIHRKISDGRVN